ncbi:MAG: NAD(+) diphosphatase [Pseudobutyrivibrio sp.]|jgi:NAD+ diphosphatase|uniref:NAD(+) diphosphatase n=1 Tax=Pseudobutyrivibrio sp. TaxID=2014367 RepID=UPI0025F968EC|nr:NAD(+) diphosphatase [Pseudobutyrivibrio sp.]MBE5905042.1 NAD(+) diphosphatase [Pseudobutyrivibrio sp.]
MLQEIQPKKLVNTYRVGEKADADSIILFNDNGRFLARIDEKEKTITYPRLKDFGVELSIVFLFSIDDEKFFLAYETDGIAESDFPTDFEFYDMKQFRREYLFPKHYVFAAFTAIQLAEWYEGTVYCGKCGTKTKHSETERAKVCPNCGKVVYPRINPAVIVGVTNGDRLLLTKYRVGYSNNALVAGFTEIGETLEETVEREVMEETGLKVKNIRYYKSQPWGIASDILMGFYCDVDGDDTIKMDESELKYAQWVPREEIELQPLEYSLTNEMMKMFKEAKV